MNYRFEEPYNEAPYNDLLKIYSTSFADNFSLPALTDYVTGKTISYGDMARRIARLHLFFELAGIQQGDKISYPELPGDSTAIINYTSGTTGFSKGVMLSLDNLRGNVVFGIRSNLHYQGSRALSFLPLAHAYGCAFDMLVPLAVGTHVTLLGKLPTPALLTKAMKQVRPSLIVCVPLILEKIYRKLIVPMITKNPVRWVLAVPMLDKAVYSLIRAKLVDAFYSPWRRFKPGSAGRTLSGIIEARILADDTLPAEAGEPQQGEILVRGLNVMKGYYKNPEATEAALEEDGWLHTGDMGRIGEPNNRTIYIRGRYKTMILTANGQNIYPEEIESKLSNMPYINECLVVERSGHLVALCHPDMEQVERDGLDEEGLKAAMEANRDGLNRLVGPYEQIQHIEIMPEEFEKTPKRSIRRFLYK